MGMVCYALLLAVIAASLSLPTHAHASEPEKGRFVLYFNGPAKTPENITLEIASVDAVREDGEKVSVLSQPLRINSVDVVDRQLLLAETFLPLGKYKAIHLGIARAQVRREGKEVDLSVPPEGFTIEGEFETKSRKATPLFMTWDVERAIEGETFLSPAFAFQGRARELRGVITYVTNEGSDTVSVIDRSVDRVVDVIEVGKGPKGIAISPERETSRALVVNSSFPTLTVIDISDNQVLRNVNLESAGSPSDVAITPDGRTVYVANTALNSVSALESVSFLTEASIQVGRKPVALAMDPRGNRLFVANQAEDTVSVIDTRRNLVTATVSVEFQPIWVVVDRLGNEAFVAHLRSRRVSVISLATLQVSRTVNIGFAAAVLPDVIGARVFAALFRRNRVSLYNVNVNAELKSVAVEKDPHRLALDNDRGKLYVVNRGSDTVTVIDRDTLRVRGTIPVGKRPYGVAIVQ